MTTDALTKLDETLSGLLEHKGKLDKLGDLDGKLARLDDTVNRLDELETRAARPGGIFGGSRAPKSLGAQVIETPEFKSLGRTADRVRLELKTTITSAPTSGGGAIVPDYRVDRPVELPRRRLAVADVLSEAQTASNTVYYLKQTTRSSSAAPAAETTLKAEAALAWETLSAQVQTIAHQLPVAKQMLDDAPAFMGLIDSELSYGVEYAEEQQLLNGDGTGANLHGLIPQATAYSAPFTAAGETALDRILQAAAQLRAAEYEPDAVIMNGSDWARLRSLKDGDGNYIIGAPMDEVQPRLWGIPVVTSNAVALDSFLIGAFRIAATIYRRHGVAVELGFANDDFIRNQVRVRAESRLALAVRRPDAIVLGDLGFVV